MFSFMSKRMSAHVFVVVSALALSPSMAAAQDAGRFDGNWNVTLVCPTDNTALGYVYHFTALVKNGVLHGEHGIADMPGWVAIDGTIRANGSATLSAKGRTNIPAHSAYQPQRGTPYTYTVEAQFESSRGNGKRVELRACTLSFVK
jgi:hypothetical protein